MKFRLTNANSGKVIKVVHASNQGLVQMQRQQSMYFFYVHNANGLKWQSASKAANANKVKCQL